MSAANGSSAAAVRVGVGTSNSGTTTTASMSNRLGTESSKTGSAGTSQNKSESTQQGQQNPWTLPVKDWRDMDARSAPFQSGNRGEATSPSTSFNKPPSTSSSSSPPKAGDSYAPALAAPRAVPPYPRFTSPQPHESVARSPSPTKPFTFGSAGAPAPGDARERWASLGQAQQTFTSQSSSQQQSTDSQRKMISSGPFPNDTFLGYNDIWGNGQRGSTAERSGEQSAPTGHSQRSYTISSSHPPDLEHLNTRFDPSNVHFTREEGYITSNGVASRSNDESQRGPFQSMTGIPASGSLSPHSLLHFHQQQVQAQQAMAMQAAQQGAAGPVNNQSSQAVMSSGPSLEEITTVFIVGFPDDMTEREFANMFLFAKGFEASTLKIPSGGPSSGPTGPGQRPGDGNAMAGPGGPYNAVNMPGSGMFDLQSNGPAGGWDEHSLSLALSRAGTGGDGFPAIGNSLNGGGANVTVAGGIGTGPGGKIKQIIGFAKFRTRSEALEARDALNGRKIDAERGCVLKTEMAKKNLHTKQRPVLSSTNPVEGQGFASATAATMAGQSAPPPPPPPPSVGFGGMPPPPTAHGGHPLNVSGAGAGGGPPLGGNAMDRDMGFIPRNRPDGQIMGPPAPFNMNQQNHSQFDPFTQQSAAPLPGVTNGLISPNSEQVYGRGGEFFPRSRLGQEGSQGSEPLRGSNVENQNLGNNGKWAPLGPLDYYEGSQQRAQQQQHMQPPPQQQQQQQSSGSNAFPGSAPRGPDWSALGSPTGLYPQGNRSNDPGSYGLSKSSAASSTGPLSPQGEQQQISSQHSQQSQQTQTQHQQSHPSQQGSGHAKQEDFGKGESTARGVVPIVSPLQSPPLHGSEKIEVNLSNPVTTRPQSRVSTQSRQGSRTTSPVNVTTSTFVQRFGSLRIDSPNLNQPRPFSPNPKSPSGDTMSIFPSQYKANSNSNTNPTSPASPFLDGSNPLPSPTSRSFSIDANPPGNTLFVGNLPGSIISPPASTQLEEALRKIFSNKKGFRQMSFRVKSTGPMCFVEFEDVGCAGRALGEANGETLEGTVKGGLRLSFSKNPLFKSTLPETNGVSLHVKIDDRHVSLLFPLPRSSF